jgi:hypothetical protein
MGPLVYYCRWRGAKLRLLGRDKRAVWGQLVIRDETGEHQESFRFNLETWELEVGEADSLKRLQLDELGVVVGPAGGLPTMTNAGDLPQ